MLNDRFIKLLAKQLSTEISEEEFNELQEMLADNELNRQQYELFKGYWRQNHRPSPNSETMFDKIKSRIGVDGDSK